VADGGSDMVDMLAKLASLRDSGALTQGEFQAAKARVLGPLPAQLEQAGPEAAQQAAPTPHVYEGQLPEDLVWNCINCGKVSGAVRRQCAYCNKDRGSAEARPWQTMDGWVGGVPKSLPGAGSPQPPPFQLPYKPRPSPAAYGSQSYPSASRQPIGYEVPRSVGNGYSTAGIILGAIAFLFFPIVLGPIGLIMGAVGKSRGEDKAVVAMVVSACGLVVGMILGIIVFDSVL